MNEKEFNIDFIGIGASRSGTSWISACLAEHPQIFIPKEKELNFFNKQYNYNQGIKFYQSFFKDCNNNIKGEFTSFYYANEEVAERIIKYFSDVKIIVSLRNPIERAFSAYQIRKKKGVEKEENFSKAIEKYKDYIKLGLYYSHLSKFLKYFKKENILILIYEDALEDPGRFIKSIYQFLGVETNFIPKSIDIRINANKDLNYKFPFINRMIIKRKDIKENKFGLWLINLLKILRVNELIKFIIRLNTSKDIKQRRKKIDIATRQKLRQVFSKDIRQLENMIGRDLSFWK